MLHFIYNVRDRTLADNRKAGCITTKLLFYPFELSDSFMKLDGFGNVGNHFNISKLRG